MKLSVPQKTVAQDPARFKTVIAGRRFGKTTLAIRERDTNLGISGS